MMKKHVLLRMLQACVACAGLWLGTASAQATAPAAAPMAYGINVLWPPGDAEVLSRRFKQARALGVTQVRTDWEWRVVEARKGHYDWSRLDALVQTAHKEGVELLPIVHYAPDWALVPGRKPADVYQMAPAQAAHEDYARFLLASIRRYGPRGDAPFAFTPIAHWQVWNEPNLRQFWGPRPNAAAFTHLMQTVQRTLVPVRSEVQLVHAGLSKSDIGFMWQMWEANPRHGETFDIMAVHPYLFDGRDGIREPDAMDKDDRNAAAMGFVGSTKDHGFLGKVFNLQLFMTLRGAPGKPIWITEMGFFIARHKLGVTEAEQAERLGKVLEFVNRRLTSAPYGTGPRALPANVQRVYWFSLEDYPSPDGFGNFGLVRPDGSERPAARAFKSFIR